MSQFGEVNTYISFIYKHLISKLALIIGDFHVPTRALDIADKFKDLLVIHSNHEKKFLKKLTSYLIKFTMSYALEILEIKILLTGLKVYQIILLP